MFRHCRVDFPSASSMPVSFFLLYCLAHTIHEKSLSLVQAGCGVSHFFFSSDFAMMSTLFAVTLSTVINLISGNNNWTVCVSA